MEKIVIQYELFKTVALNTTGAKLIKPEFSDLVHLEDPAIAVMHDFNTTPAHTISPNASMDDALNEMKLYGQHLLLVLNGDDRVEGIISSEDLLGEKPIKIIQERRIRREKVTVKMLMVPINKIAAFPTSSVEKARVGNVVNSMKDLKAQYALVVTTNPDESQTIRGLFHTSQVSKKLHKDIMSDFSKADTVSELQQRHVDE